MKFKKLWFFILIIFCGAAIFYRAFFFAAGDDWASGKKSHVLDGQSSQDAVGKTVESTAGLEESIDQMPGGSDPRSIDDSGKNLDSGRAAEYQQANILAGAMLEQRIEELVREEFPKGQVQRDSSDGIGSRVVEMKTERGDQVMTMYDPGGRVVMETWIAGENEITRSFDETGKPFLITVRQSNGVRTEALLAPDGKITSRTEVRDDDYLEQKSGEQRDPLLDSQEN